MHMLHTTRRSARPRRPARRTLTLLLTCAAALAVLLAGTGRGYAADGRPDATAKGPAATAIGGIGAVPTAGVPAALAKARTDTVKGSPITLTAPAKTSGGTVNAGPDDPPPALAVCSPTIGKAVTPGAYGAWTIRVDFYGDVSCTNNVSATGVAYVYDRTSGAPYNDSVVYSGNTFSFGSGTYGLSYGSLAVHGGIYDGAQQLEIGLYLQLTALNGATWQCQVPITGLRYLTACQGIGTTSLRVEMGSYPFGTGLYPYMSLPLADSAANRAAYGAAHHDHPAVDIPVPVGTPVKAVRDGTVTTFYEEGGCGYGVQVAGSDGAVYTYCHLSGYTIANGSATRAGGVIGYSGNTGASTGPHLHVQIRAGGSLRCPQSMLQSIWDYVPPPAASALPVSGCTY